MIEVGNRVFYMTSKDFKTSANLGVYGERVELSVFDSTVKSAPIIKHLFTPTSLVQFKLILSKILKDPESLPIKITSQPMNRELKVREFKSSVAVGRDEEKAIYFEFCGEKHKDPVRVYLNTDNSYMIQDMELPLRSLTEAGCQAILEFIPSLALAALSASGNRRSNGGGTGAGTGSTTTGTPKPNPIGEEMPF